MADAVGEAEGIRRGDRDSSGEVGGATGEWE